MTGGKKNDQKLERSYFLFCRGEHWVQLLPVVTWEEDYAPYDLVDLGETAMKENFVLLAPSSNALIKRWFQSVAQHVRKNGRE